MKTILPLLAALFLAGGLAQAADAQKPAAAPAAAAAPAPAPAAEKKLTSSQQRMTDCNKEAGDKKGDARKEFMRQCMHGGSAPATPPAKMSQQDRMKACNKEAGEKALKGDERKAFMSGCLKAK